MGFFAKAGEDGPMLLSGSNQGTMRLIHQQFAKADYFIEPARLGENPGMSCDTDDSAQHLGRHPVAGVTINDAFQPPATQRVLVSIATESIHEHIDVRKDHVRSMRSSRSADRVRSMPGNVPPEALETGKRTPFRGGCLGSASTALSPSSTSDVSVWPLSAAFFLALRRRSSESRIVVLVICQSIQTRHQYVNRLQNGGRCSHGAVSPCCLGNNNARAPRHSSPQDESVRRRTRRLQHRVSHATRVPPQL